MSTIRQARLRLLLSSLWIAFALSAQAAPEGLAAQRTAITAKLRGKAVEGRLEGVAKLVEYPSADAARLLIQYPLRDESPEVRRAAYEALLKFKDTLGVCDYLVDTLNAEAKRAKPDPNSPLFLAVLMSSSIAYVDQSSQRFIEESLAKHKDGGLFLVTMVDLLATHAAPADVAPLRKVTRTSMFEKQFGLRRAVVQALTNIDDREAIDLLVSLLAMVDGEVSVDIMYHLSLVSDKKYTEAAAWADWWRETKDKFEFPKPWVRPKERDFGRLAIGDTSAYYGLPLYGQRIVFVIDNSGSMAGPRLESAQRELIAAIQGLKDNQKFGIIVYNSQVAFWKRELVPADTASKLDAVKFVNLIQAGDRTATYDALHAAFYFNAEAIYLLTDGEPSFGRVIIPIDIITAISQENRARRQSIYTIGLAPSGPVGDGFDLFLSELARENHGTYKRVDLQ